MSFAQLVVGSPGSGKTTFCHGMQQFLTAAGRRPILVNLDPANDHLPYACDVDVRDLLTLSETMEKHRLGPNGALVFVIEHLFANVSWLMSKLSAFDDSKNPPYFVFDLPGQVELFTNNDSLRLLFRKLAKEQSLRIAVVNLTDATHCIDPAKWISVLLLSLRSMLQLELPAVHLIAKIDLIEASGELPMPLAAYTDIEDLHFLCLQLDESLPEKWHKLNAALCGLVEDFGLLSFVPINVEDKKCMAFALREIDKANGHVFGGLTGNNESVFGAASTGLDREAYLQYIADAYMAVRDYDGE